MSAPEGYIQVVHGSLTVNVPRNLFKGTECTIAPARQEEFSKLLRSRYPGLTEGSLEVFYRAAQREMLAVKDEETGGRNGSANLEKQGDIEGAIRHLKQYLAEDPDDADSWLALGNLLCKAGRADEGYKAINKARSLY